MWPWGNEEDGVDGLDGNPPKGWREWADGKDKRDIVVKWSSWRNPQNNLRYVPVLSPKYAPTRMKAFTWGTGNFFVYQFPYSSLRLRFGELRFWIGWKFKPEDVNGIPADDTRLPRADFTIQFKRKLED